MEPGVFGDGQHWWQGSDFEGTDLAEHQVVLCLLEELQHSGSELSLCYDCLEHSANQLFRQTFQT